MRLALNAFGDHLSVEGSGHLDEVPKGYHFLITHVFWIPYEKTSQVRAASVRHYADARIQQLHARIFKRANSRCTCSDGKHQHVIYWFLRIQCGSPRRCTAHGNVKGRCGVHVGSDRYPG